MSSAMIAMTTSSSINVNASTNLDPFPRLTCVVILFFSDSRQIPVAIMTGQTASTNLGPQASRIGIEC